MPGDVVVSGEWVQDAEGEAWLRRGKYTYTDGTMLHGEFDRVRIPLDRAHEPLLTNLIEYSKPLDKDFKDIKENLPVRHAVHGAGVVVGWNWR